jgi:hypothetical protein
MLLFSNIFEMSSIYCRTSCCEATLIFSYANLLLTLTVGRVFIGEQSTGNVIFAGMFIGLLMVHMCFAPVQFL